MQQFIAYFRALYEYARRRLGGIFRPKQFPFEALLTKIAASGHGWHQDANGRVTCFDGYCVLGSLMKENGLNFPTPSFVAQMLGIRYGIDYPLAVRFIRANDGAYPEHDRRYLLRRLRVRPWQKETASCDKS